jgi:pyochelin biosynthesis protein PchC
MTGSARTPSAWFRVFRPVPDPAFRLLCLPHAGGAANVFAPWPPLLPPQGELVAVQYPGRQNRISEPCVPSIPGLAALIAQHLPALPGRPLAIFGHSMGAVVGYEVAARLEQQQGTPVHLLAVSAGSPPHRRPPLPPLPDDAAVLARGRQLGGFDDRVLGNPDLCELVLPAIRSDMQAVRDYACPRPAKLKAPIVAYAGDSDAEVSLDQLRAWSEVTLSDFACRLFPGGHFYLDAHASALVSDIVSRIGAVGS